jgi:hypothetical protein
MLCGVLVSNTHTTMLNNTKYNQNKGRNEEHRGVGLTALAAFMLRAFSNVVRATWKIIGSFSAISKLFFPHLAVFG